MYYVQCINIGFIVNILQRQDILKAKFLSSDSGTSPANFFITHQFIDTVSAQPHQGVSVSIRATMKLNEWCLV